jgi:hypothetical protein
LGNSSFPGFSGTAFEPINEYKGDFARAMLYMVTRYETDMTTWQNNANAGDILNGTIYPSLKDWYVKLLFKWHTQDPPSAKEISRNDAIYALQGNRNPFVDRPEFVALIWQCTGLIPVTLIDFKASKTTNAISLNWTATRESNFRQYEIERSIDGTSFNKIGTIAGRNLDSYTTADNNLPNTRNVFYRLKMLDIDGKFTYSKVVAVRLFNASGRLVFPNPSTTELTIKLQQSLIENTVVKISDIAGRVMLEKKIVAGQNSIPVNIRSLAAGKYFVTIQNIEDIIQESFIKVN